MKKPAIAVCQSLKKHPIKIITAAGFDKISPKLRLYSAHINLHDFLFFLIFTELSAMTASISSISIVSGSIEVLLLLLSVYYFLKLLNDSTFCSTSLFIFSFSPSSSSSSNWILYSGLFGSDTVKIVRSPATIPKPPTTYHAIFHPSQVMRLVVANLNGSPSCDKTEKAKNAFTLYFGAKKSVIIVKLIAPDRP